MSTKASGGMALLDLDRTSEDSCQTEVGGDPVWFLTTSCSLGTEGHTDLRVVSRTTYRVVMPKQCVPISSLTKDWDAFMTAFVSVFCGESALCFARKPVSLLSLSAHARLWNAGIRHGDISEDTLLWDTVTEKPKLYDFDLCYPSNLAEPGNEGQGQWWREGFSNAGTWYWKFMASELLTNYALDGHVKRVYRHEVEAFVSVLVWIVCRYTDGRLRPDPPLQKWNHHHCLHVKEERTYTFERIVEGRFPKPIGLPDDFWLAIDLTLDDMACHLIHARMAERAQALAKHRAILRDTPAPSERLEHWNDLCALPTKILTWAIFKLPSATRFFDLLKEDILNTPGKLQETML